MAVNEEYGLVIVLIIIVLCIIQGTEGAEPTGEGAPQEEQAMDQDS